MAIVLRKNEVRLDSNKQLLGISFGITIARNGTSTDVDIKYDGEKCMGDIEVKLSADIGTVLTGEFDVRRMIKLALEESLKHNGYRLVDRVSLTHWAPGLYRAEVALSTVSNGQVNELSETMTDPEVIAAFEKRYREKYSNRFVSIEAQFDKRNGEYIDGETQECFEFFCEGCLVAKGVYTARFKELVEGLKTNA